MSRASRSNAGVALAARCLAGFARLASVAGLAVLTAPAGAQAWRGPLEAYASWPSVRAGESLELHVSCRAPAYDLTVHRHGETDVRWEQRGLPGTLRDVPDGAPGVDCGWPVDCTIPVGADWASGTWWVRLSAPSAPDENCEIPFIVRPAAPTARILALSSACTVAAYEAWGGASLYPSAYGPPTPVVTLHRPHDHATYHGLLRHGDPAMEAWLDARGLPVDCAADIDLQREPDLLDGYDLLLLVGHHEYWSATMRARVDAFVGDGGRLAVLGANTCYWQIRFEQDGTAIRCHKRPTRDPLWGSPAEADRRRVTSTWLGEPVLDPQERSFGLSWQHASWSAPLEPGLDLLTWSLGIGPDSFPSEDGFGCWRIAAPTQADQRGLGLARGALLGAARLGDGADAVRIGLCGGEVDGALVEECDGLRPASAALGAPRNLLVLADAPAQEGYAAIASFERGGELLWCSSERFTRGLTEARIAAPDLSTLVESALRRMSRPRRNALIHGSFETWDGGVPRGWTATGDVRSAGRALATTGEQALQVTPGAAVTLRQAVRGFRADRAHLLLAFARTAAREPVLSLVAADDRVLAATRPVSADGLVHAAFAPAGNAPTARAAAGATPDHAGPDRDVRDAASVRIDTAAGDGLLIDQVELLDEDALRAESLALTPSADGARLLAAPTPGGALHLALVTDRRAATLVLLDAVDGRVLASVTRDAPADRDDPEAPGAGALMLAAADRARGGMARLALEVRDADGLPLPTADAWLLPLRVPAPAPSPLLEGGDFEHTADASDLPPGWQLEGAADGSVCALRDDARLAGRSGLHVETADDPLALSRPVTLTSDGEPLALTACVRGAGELTLSLLRDGVVLAQRSLQAEAAWHAVRLFIDAPADAHGVSVELRVGAGARLDLDAVDLRPASALLIDDLYPNGGFELAPSEPEIARGADWTARLPRWAARSGPPPRLDSGVARHGGRALRIEPGAVAVTRLGWPLAWDRALLVGVSVLPGGSAPVTLRLLVGKAGDAAPPEVAHWTRTGGAPSRAASLWEDALLCVASAGTDGEPPEAYLVVEAGADGAWLDDLSVVPAGD